MEAFLLLFRQMEGYGTIELIHELIRDELRKKAGKNESSNVEIIDSQSVKTTLIGGLNQGIDGGKKTKGI